VTVYDPDNTALPATGTLDKLYIDGRYYSDKPYLVSYLLAGIYRAWQVCGGPKASERPDLYCLFLTWCTSGLAYVVAVTGMWILGRRLGLASGLCFFWTASFALATVALPYTRHVNNHAMFLGVAVLLFVQLDSLREEIAAGRVRAGRLVLLGTLAGLAYVLDLATGPMLLLCLGLLLLWRVRRLAPLTVFAMSVLPWLVAHHTLNYQLGGTFKPANAVTTYLDWPQSPFAGSATGAWCHTPGHFVWYALEMLVGKKGFLLYNLPLLLAQPALVMLAARRLRATPELLFGLAWTGGTWLLYAACSNNFSGGCCSIRWFVPLLVPGYLLLATLLREHPDVTVDLAILTAGGLVLAAIMWHIGPWSCQLPPGLWFVVCGTVASCLSWRIWHWRQRRPVGQRTTPVPLRRAA
jgi:hypothetical protein